jgi:hypothetical protein
VLGLVDCRSGRLTARMRWATVDATEVTCRMVRRTWRCDGADVARPGGSSGSCGPHQRPTTCLRTSAREHSRDCCRRAHRPRRCWRRLGTRPTCCATRTWTNGTSAWLRRGTLAVSSATRHCGGSWFGLLPRPAADGADGAHVVCGRRHDRRVSASSIVRSGKRLTVRRSAMPVDRPELKGPPPGPAPFDPWVPPTTPSVRLNPRTLSGDGGR